MPDRDLISATIAAALIQGRQFSWSGSTPLESLSGAKTSSHREQNASVSSRKPKSWAGQDSTGEPRRLCQVFESSQMPYVMLCMTP